MGSIYESAQIKSETFELFHELCAFTDDTVMTVAVADALLNNLPYASNMQKWGRKYPNAGYGVSFYHWLFSKDPKPYNSWGNGAAMRVSPIGFAFSTIEEVKKEAGRSAAVSHNHPEGIKGAQAAAAAVYYARFYKDKEKIRSLIQDEFGYDLNRTAEEIRKDYQFDGSCQKSVPEAIVAFLDSKSFEDAIRKAVSLGGDSDTQACIAGGIAEAYYGYAPAEIEKKTRCYLPAEMLTLIDEFYEKYQLKKEPAS